MPNFKILIVEDDPLYALDLKMLIEELGYDLVDIADNADEVFDIVNNKNVDLVLMDVKIKGKLNGIEVAEKIQKTHSIAIIFITSFEDRSFFDRAKNTKHHGYLIKPFNKITLESTIELAVMSLTDDGLDPAKEEENNPDFKGWNEDVILEDFVFIKRNSKLEKVAINQIEFIQSEGNYCVISTERKKYALKMSLIKVKKMLDSHPFARVNKRHIINMNLISSIDLSTNQIDIDNVSFAIGRTYKEGLLKRLKTLS